MDTLDNFLATQRSSQRDGSPRSEAGSSVSAMDTLLGLEEERRTALGASPRFDSTQFNVLKGAGREILHESLKLSKLGENGLHRYDVAKNKRAIATGWQERDFYMASLKNTKGSLDYAASPLFMVKGLVNFSNLPRGDPRVWRGTSTSREQFIPPEHRAPVPPKFSNLQPHETWDVDSALGPATPSKANASASGRPPRPAALAVDQAQLEGGLSHSENSSVYRLAELEALELLARRSVYRECVEQLLPSELQALEAKMLEKLENYGALHGSCRGFQQRNSWRFLDRDGKGVVDLAGFMAAFEDVGMTFELQLGAQHGGQGRQRRQVAALALFSQYDPTAKGFLDFGDFNALLYERANKPRGLRVPDKDANAVGRKVGELMAQYKRSGRFPPALPPRALGELGAAEFRERQKLRAVFESLGQPKGSLPGQAAEALKVGAAVPLGLGLGGGLGGGLDELGLGQAVRMMGVSPPVSDPDLKALFKAACRDGADRVTLEGFAALVLQAQAPE